jgi:sphingomyelin phosphodiesterase acid-like 3
MENRRIQAYVILLAVTLLLVPSEVVSAPLPREQQFIWLSDIHFDPLADPTLTDKLAGAEASQWQAIFASSSSAKLSQFGEDTNWPLFSSAIEVIGRTVPNPSFVMVTGDLLVHHFREHFNGSASVHDDAAFEDFVRKTTEFVGLQLKRIAASKPVLVSLGNNDADCGDYLLQPDGKFLHDTQPIVADLLKEPDSSVLSGWPEYGSYSVPHPVLKSYRIVAINTVLFSARFRNACGNGQGDPGEKLMSWLDAELAKAKKSHEKVWLMYHIPPGIDGFATTRHNGEAVPFWKVSYGENFDRLLSRYHDVIAASFAGHTHTDDFRLVGSPGQRRSLVLMTPAVSPVVKQNPAFRVVQFGRNGVLMDQVTYYLSSLETPEWKQEYSFDRAWGFHQINIKNFEKLYLRIDTSPEIRDRWSLFYSVSHPAGGSITQQSFWALHCASGHSTISEYQSCLSSHKADSAP